MMYVLTVTFRDLAPLFHRSTTGITGSTTLLLLFLALVIIVFFPIIPFLFLFSHLRLLVVLIDGNGLVAVCRAIKHRNIGLCAYTALRSVNGIVPLLHANIANVRPVT